MKQMEGIMNTTIIVIDFKIPLSVADKEDSKKVLRCALVFALMLWLSGKQLECLFLELKEEIIWY